MKTTRSSLFDDEQVLGLRNEFPEEHIDFRAGGLFLVRGDSNHYNINKETHTHTHKEKTKLERRCNAKQTNDRKI